MVRNNPVTFKDHMGLMLYHIVDTRSEQALAGKAAVDFELPDITYGEKIKVGKNKYNGTTDYYLTHSANGNMFSGVMNIKSGVVDIYPLSTKRNDMIDTSWGQEYYKGKFHDNGKSIEHPGQGSNAPVSHLQLVAKINGISHDEIKNHKINDNYIGFTLLDVRGLRRTTNTYLNEQVSMLYGASRSLNTRHVNIMKDDRKAISYENNIETFKRNEGGFTYHLPIELKREILIGIKKGLSDRALSSWGSAIDKELQRDELNVRSYDDAIKAKAKPVRVYV
jgi:hypothetical protein